MSSNVCGNCANFKPARGAKFFNCTSAKHLGLDYGMQVRADSRSCDAFVPVKASAKAAQSPAKAGATSQSGRREPVKLCPWVRIVLLILLVVVIVLVSWLIYTCVSGGISRPPGPTPTPTGVATPGPTAPTGGPGPTATGIATPRPQPTPVPVSRFKVGEFAEGSPERISITTARRTTGDGEVWAAPYGTIYVRITVVVESTGASFKLADFVVVDSQGRRSVMTEKRGSSAFISGAIPGGKTFGGTAWYLMPDTAYNFDVHHYVQGLGPAIWELPW